MCHLARLLVAMAAGAVFGSFAPGGAIRVLNSFGGSFAELVKFAVPLIIVGLVTPAIANAGRNAGRMLVAIMALAYASTILAGVFGFTVADSLFPRILSGALVEQDAAKSFPAYFILKIPPVMGVVSAMALAFVFGLAMAKLRSKALSSVFDEMKDVVTLAISKAVVPLLPFYIFSVVADLSARGTLRLAGSESLKIAATAFATTVVLLVVQYLVAGIASGRNPLKALWTMLPAYFTGLGCCSSAATIPVTLRQVKANGVGEETADLVVPLCANIHLAGSMAKIVVFATGFTVLAGRPPSIAAFAQFIFLISILAVAAPGVPGGMVLAAAPIAESVLGIPPHHYAILIAAYLSIDGVGTACNLTGDGAIALIVDKMKG